jgi:hypothetical protein
MSAKRTGRRRSLSTPGIIAPCRPAAAVYFGAIVAPRVGITEALSPRVPTRPPRNALAIVSPRWDDAVCVRMKSGVRKPPRGTTHRALACSLQRCWVRPLTAWPSLHEVAGRLSSRSAALVGHCHDRNRSFDLSPCLAALVRT